MCACLCLCSLSVFLVPEAAEWDWGCLCWEEGVGVELSRSLARAPIQTQPIPHLRIQTHLSSVLCGFPPSLHLQLDSIVNRELGSEVGLVSWGEVEARLAVSLAGAPYQPASPPSISPPKRDNRKAETSPHKLESATWELLSETECGDRGRVAIRSGAGKCVARGSERRVLAVGPE